MGKIVEPTVGYLPGRKSQSDLEPFGIGIPFGVWVRLPLKSPSLWSQKNFIEPTDTHLFTWYKIHGWCIKHVYNTTRSKIDNKACTPKEILSTTHLWGYYCRQFWPRKKQFFMERFPFTFWKIKWNANKKKSLTSIKQAINLNTINTYTGNHDA